MTLEIIYPEKGRGSFSINAQLGGTLNVKGDGPGPYYRARTRDSLRMPGAVAAVAVRTGGTCTIDDYAVYMAIKAMQPFFDTVPDGVIGPNTDKAIKAYQTQHKLYVDGVIGPKTSRMMFEPLVAEAVQFKRVDARHGETLRRIATGTITVESGYWDPGAVGRETPYDLGLGQINAIHSKTPTDLRYISVDDRLRPHMAIPWVVDFIDDNLIAMNYDEDASIAAYNLGRTGANSWVRAGRPELFWGTNVWEYIDKIKTFGA